MISIILPFYKKLRDFERVLPLNRRYFNRPWIEVVIPLDECESEPGLVALLQQYPDIRWKVVVNDEPHGWQPPCKSINVGLRHASHDAVLVCSPESLFVTDVPARALNTLAAVPRGVAVGQVGFGTYAQLHALGAEAAFGATAVKKPTPFQFYGSIACARREFEAIGGYDEAFIGWGGDDDNVRVRLVMNGARLLACPEMKLLHLSDAPRTPSPHYDAQADLRKCSPASALANADAEWGRAFGRLAWQSPPSPAPAATGDNAVPAIANPAFLIPSRQCCPVCGRLVQAQSALPFCLRCMPAGTDEAPAGAPRIVCVMQARNEARHLPGCLDHLRDHVDGFVILDDGSTDRTPDIIRAEPKLLERLDNPVTHPHTWNERRNKQLLLEAAQRHQAQWVLICDADERFETLFLRGLQRIGLALDRMGFLMLTVALRELWDTPRQYRVDGKWGHKRGTRLMKLPKKISFDASLDYHDTWIPDSMRPASCLNQRHATLFYNLYHLKMVHATDRMKRRDFYKKLDPENKLQWQGYDYLTEVGESLQTECIAPERGYDFDTLPADLQAMLKP